VITLTEGSAPGDPEVDFPAEGQGEDEAFALLRKTVQELMDELGGDPPLSGLKDQLRKRQEDFSEKDLGYSGLPPVLQGRGRQERRRDGLGGGRRGVLPGKRIGERPDVAGFDDLVDQAVLEGLLGGHPVVAVGVRRDLLDRTCRCARP
jgi:hypothetical protein